MSASQEYSVPIIDSILHPSNFSAASEVAFARALKAELIAKSQLTMMHVSPSMTAEWTDFPGVRETLARWGLLPGVPLLCSRQVNGDCKTSARENVGQKGGVSENLLHGFGRFMLQNFISFPST
jgi:hypothetical protein